MKNIQFSKQELEFIKQYTIQEMSAFSNGVRNFADDASAPKTEGEAAVVKAQEASSGAGSEGESTFGSMFNNAKNAGANWADNASKNSFGSASRGLTDTIGNLFKDPGKTWSSLGSGEKFGLIGGAAALGAIPLATFLMSKKENKWRNTLLSMLPAAAIGAGIAGLGTNAGQTAKAGQDPMDKLSQPLKNLDAIEKGSQKPSTPMTPISEMAKKTSPEYIAAQQKFGVGNLKDIQESRTPSLLANPNSGQKGPVVPPLNTNVSSDLNWKPDYDKTVKGFGYKTSLDTYSPSEKQAILKSKFSGSALTAPDDFERSEKLKAFDPALESDPKKVSEGLGLGTHLGAATGRVSTGGGAKSAVRRFNQEIEPERVNYDYVHKIRSPFFGHGPIKDINDPLWGWGLPGGGAGRISYTPKSLRGITMPTAGVAKSKFSQ